MTEDPFSDLLDQLDEMTEPDSAGVGVWCQAKFFVGMKTFAKGLPSQDGTLIEFDIGDNAGKKAAIASINELLKSNEIDTTASNTRATRVVGFHLYQETAVGKDWSSDLVKMVPTWTEAYADSVRPALKELATAKLFKGFGQKYWAHFSLVADPSGREETRENDEGEEETRPIFVWVPDAIYPNEAACIAAAEVARADSGSPPAKTDSNVPEGYTADLWADYEPKVVEALVGIREGEGPPPVKQEKLNKLAEDYGLTPEFLETL